MSRIRNHMFAETIWMIECGVCHRDATVENMEEEEAERHFAQRGWTAHDGTKLIVDGQPIELKGLLCPECEKTYLLNSQ